MQRSGAARPVVTWSVIGLLLAVFLAEQVFGLEPSSGLLRPTLRTLVALGSFNGKLVLGGEWWRMLTASLLHLDLAHLAANCLALALCGTMIERLIGREWLSGTLFVGAFGGSLGSLIVNDATMHSIGASGAITAVLACGYVAAWRLTTKEERSQVHGRLVGFLLPALIPLAQPTGIKVDIAGHIGGAAAGALVGLVILGAWSREEDVPRLRRAAACVAAVGAVCVTAAFVPVVLRHHSFALALHLSPTERLPKTEAAMRAEIADLVSRYPRDPRLRLAWAQVLRERKDLVGAERELKAALDDETLALFEPKLAALVRDTLAGVVAQQQQQAPAVAPERAEARAPGTNQPVPATERSPASERRLAATPPMPAMEGGGLDFDPEEAVWARAETTSDVALLREFLRNFPEGRHAGAARERLALVEQQAAAVRVEPPAAGNSGPAASYAFRPVRTVAAHPVPLPPAAPSPSPAPTQPPTPMRLATGAPWSSTNAGQRASADKPGEEAAWQRAGTSFDLAVLESFLKLYPGGRYATEARERLDLLRRKGKAEAILKAMGATARP
jgi:rhomboid protease GluP